MTLDDLMLVIAGGGLALSIASLGAEFARRSRSKAAERRLESRVRELYTRPDRGARNTRELTDSAGDDSRHTGRQSANPAEGAWT